MNCHTKASKSFGINGFKNCKSSNVSLLNKISAKKKAWTSVSIEYILFLRCSHLTTLLQNCKSELFLKHYTQDTLFSKGFSSRDSSIIFSKLAGANNSQSSFRPLIAECTESHSVWV